VSRRSSTANLRAICLYREVFFEQVIFDHLWSRRDLLTSKSKQFKFCPSLHLSSEFGEISTSGNVALLAVRETKILDSFSKFWSNVSLGSFASLSLLGPTCVPDQHYQDLWPYWDLIWDPVGFFIDFDSLTLSMPRYNYKPHRSNYYPYRVLTHPSISIGSSIRVYCVCNTPA